MSRFGGSLRRFGFSVAVLCLGLSAVEAATLPSTGLMGVVKSADGKAMEGVAVSARANSQTFSTSVFTDGDGQYYFPALAEVRYKVWAQAVGFEMARGELAVASGKKFQQNFTLRPMKDFQMQLSGAEWAESLPGDTPEDRRMKELVHSNCTGCHLTGFVLAKRFDAAGWGIILNAMIETQTQPEAPNRKLLEAYKEDLVAYLARVRGPNPSAMKFKPFPRVTGEATQIVVTEYDIPRGDNPNFVMLPNGSDWSEGIASGDGGVLHDAVAGKDGNVYFSDNTYPERTIGRLDPRTGRVTSFKLEDKTGLASRTHGAIPDSKGNIWFNNGTDGTIIKFDPATEKFQLFPKPQGGGWVGGHIEVDSKGNVWTSANVGAVKLNPATGEYTDYKSITPGGGIYGIAVDAEDNAWIAQLGADRLMVANGRTGEVSEVVLSPLMEGVSEKDREIGRRSGAANNTAPLYFKGPRRLGGDPKGDSVWVAEFWAGRLARINSRTKKVTEYQLPSKYAHPYDVQVDKNQMVWINQMNSDRVAKFNPFTEQFTEYPLASLGTETRHISIDDSTTPPTIWLAYSGLAKIGRVQFRTDTARSAAGRQ
ncbi:MAG: hypothetical protein A3H28_09145 [Acidobacteria bacterium RIFCSPLOWO2_02_FULL_61_28]|nr:MAG: hypothetical protein A3H28_09145 [Acidobacteria bacterium RIFCSPLOWO2_02_FULL_61_28]